ncbi:MAG: aminotransferase class V-fold PLP-dependent enzyme [Bacteroidales bacterium]|nr:aminotransferase class V-fold PLP-dependent enzyme [Bacteroidales bacterium]
MLSFESDYNNGAHPLILQRLVETNSLQSLTYGFDQWSESARAKIRTAAQCPDADIYFLSGGTQTNMTVIDGCLQSYEAVIAVESGHISIHEASAIESTGHKVITLQHHDGKMLPADLREYMQWFANDQSRDHLAQPGMVYITYPTEFGTIYTKSEIEEIYAICQQYGLLLFIDGARLGYGLMVEGSDVSLPWLSKHCDVYYIGGTKVGALCGEAVVFPRGNAPKHFFSIVKRHGALSAKGRTIGIQFDVLFTNDLYFAISQHAISMAMRLKNTLLSRGYQLYIDSPSNQQFVVLPNNKVKELSTKVEFTIWQPYDATSQVCRFVTSWSTTEEQFAELEEML